MASLTSEHSQQVFMTCCMKKFILGPREGIPKKHQTMWQDLAIALAGCECQTQNKLHTTDLHDKMFLKYGVWAEKIVEECKESYPELNYVCIELFTFTDVKMTKPRVDEPKARKAFWKRFMLIRRNVVNRDNAAVKAAMKVTNGKIPSGKSAESSFMPELMKRLFLAAQKEPKVPEEGLGGSSSKAAATKGDDDVTDDVVDDDAAAADDDADGEATVGGMGGSSPSQNTRQKSSVSEAALGGTQVKLFSHSGSSGGSSGNPWDDDTKWIPDHLLIIVWAGVLSGDPQEPLNFAVSEEKGASGASREDLRTTAKESAKAAKDAKKAASSSSSSSSGSSSSSTDARANSMSAFVDSRNASLTQETYANQLLAYHSQLQAREQKTSELNVAVAMSRELLGLEEEGSDEIGPLKKKLKEDLNAAREFTKTAQPSFPAPPAEHPAPAAVNGALATPVPDGVAVAAVATSE
jgi:hypothetical protein